jgi:acid phosphatase (class A)
MANRLRNLTGRFAFGAAALLTSGALFGSAAAQSTMAAARSPKTLEALTPYEVDPARLLPPPPPDGSDRQKAELAEVQRVYRSRSPERYAAALWDDKHESSEIFASALGPGFDLKKLPATARLLAIVENDQSVSATMAKNFFLRNRPWAMDPSLIPCDYKPGAKPRTSYPSGHATLGYSVGYVLAALAPEKAQAIQARAADYAYSRIVCGDHYPSDLEASHALGVAVGLQLLSNPGLAEPIAAAKAELARAGLTRP